MGTKELIVLEQSISSLTKSRMGTKELIVLEQSISSLTKSRD